VAPTSAPTARVRGTVAWFNKASGFGFIRTENGRNVFVQEAAINVPGRQTLEDGQPVELEVVERDGRREAADVVPLPSALS